jgi:hypothetical protein
VIADPEFLVVLKALEKGEVLGVGGNEENFKEAALTFLLVVIDGVVGLQERDGGGDRPVPTEVL